VVPHQATRRQEVKIEAQRRRGSGSAIRQLPPPTPTPHMLFALDAPSCPRLLLFVCGKLISA